MARSDKPIARKLLAAARVARTELFALMLAEQAHRVHGRFSDAFERLDKAIKEAEADLNDE